MSYAIFYAIKITHMYIYDNLFFINTYFSMQKRAMPLRFSEEKAIITYKVYMINSNQFSDKTKIPPDQTNVF